MSETGWAMFILGWLVGTAGSLICILLWLDISWRRTFDAPPPWWDWLRFRLKDPGKD